MEVADNKEVKSKKQTFLERFKAKHPEIDPNDEEGLYGGIDGDYTNSEKMEGDRKKISDLFSSDPKSAAFFTHWVKGEDPLLGLVKHFGADAIKEVLDDPKKAEEMTKANQDYLDRVTSSKKLEETYKKNLLKTNEEIDKAEQEKGYTEDQIEEAVQTITQVMEDCIMGKISVETIEMVLKAKNHDQDVDEAAKEAEVKAKNDKIDRLELKKPDLPTLSGKSNPVKAKKKMPDVGVLANYQNNESMWKGLKRFDNK